MINISMHKYLINKLLKTLIECSKFFVNNFDAYNGIVFTSVNKTKNPICLHL